MPFHTLSCSIRTFIHMPVTLGLWLPVFYGSWVGCTAPPSPASSVHIPTCAMVLLNSAFLPAHRLPITAFPLVHPVGYSVPMMLFIPACTFPPQITPIGLPVPRTQPFPIPPFPSPFHCLLPALPAQEVGWVLDIGHVNHHYLPPGLLLP